MKKLITLFVIIYFLSSCSFKKKYFQKKFVKNTSIFNITTNKFFNNIENVWGINEILIAGPKDYVKYINNYSLRSHINFNTGIITIESISGKNLIKNMRKEIVNTLLINNSPDNIGLYSTENNLNPINNNLLLYGQVLDHKSNPIFFKKDAINFANYLLDKKIKVRFSGSKLIWSIIIPMIPHHVDKRAYKYFHFIQRASKKYKINQSLILAIIKIESSFNPYAISNSDAVGLMQVMQHTAGADVFRTQGKLGAPSRRYLLNPKKNIDTGVAYLSILKQNYLSNIDNPVSQLYAIITAYNGGTGNLLKTFNNDKILALKKINSISPKKVYQILLHEHPSEETRRYLYKVNNMQKKYNFYI